jgi:hypothetical protein
MKNGLFLMLLSTLFVVSCRENTPDIVATSTGDVVEIFLLDTYEKTNYLKINESTITLKSTPLVAYADIVSYDSTNHVLKLTDNGKNAITSLAQSGIRMAFAVKARGAVIYTGYFWSSIMSSSCDWMVMDILELPTKNQMVVGVEYPNPSNNGTDRRNDKRIIDVFKGDNKLIR